MRNKVLIVDDVELNRDILSDMLCDEYEILTAGDGRQAINIMNNEIGNIAAILLDLIQRHFGRPTQFKLNNINILIRLDHQIDPTIARPILRLDVIPHQLE